MAAAKLRLFHLKLVESFLIPQISTRINRITYCTTKSDKPDVDKKNFKESDSEETILAKSNSDQVILEDKKDAENADSKTTQSKSDLSGFAVFESKQIGFVDKPKEEPETFAALLRNSKFIDLGDPEGKIVVGTIYRVVDNDLYIDFGWKFPTVCSKPKKNQNLYVRGAKVKLLVKDLELSSRFLGSTTDITLLEADCVLLGLESAKGKEA